MKNTPGTVLSNDTHKYGSILDRFLPVRQSSSVATLYKTMPRSELKKQDLFPIYRVRPQTEHNDSNNASQEIIQSSNIYENPFLFGSNFINDDYQSLNSEDEADESIGDVHSVNINETKEKSIHESSIANALGFKKSRILNFRPLRSPTSKKQKSAIEYASDSNDFSNNSHIKRHVKKAPIVQTEVPFKVLDAPGLRNDFYSNVVCWSKKSDKIAVGLGSVVYTWSELKGTVPLQSLGSELISALAYNYEDILAVATKNGKIYIYDHESNYITTTATLSNTVSVCSLKWLPETRNFFTGDDMGNVTLFEVHQSDEPNLQLRNKLTFKCDQQQICGLDVDHNKRQLAIGANNNSSSIWDITDLLRPKKMFHLPHEAAVKAIAFCPWMPNLLATGGGSRDRQLRFWHTASGTLISKHETKGQITSIIWSHSHKEILVTFGFGSNADRNGIISVFSYPSMKLKIKLDAPPNMRVLSSDLSNDCRCICTAISDQSVRIYTIWDFNYNFKKWNYDNGVFGSEIIDLEEGVDTNVHAIR